MNELAPGSVSLEDDNPSLESLSQPPEPEPPAPEPPPQAAANPDDVEPEGVVVNPSGEKLVPLKALVATREKAREKDAALEAKEQEIIALREKATKYDQVAGEWQAAQPLLQQLRNGSYQPAPQKPQVNEKAAEYAKFLDLYKSDGTPEPSPGGIERATWCGKRAVASSGGRNGAVGQVSRTCHPSTAARGHGITRIVRADSERTLPRGSRDDERGQHQAERIRIDRGQLQTRPAQRTGVTDGKAESGQVSPESLHS
jgi:hypothetical protein